MTGLLGESNKKHRADPCTEKCWMIHSISMSFTHHDRSFMNKPLARGRTPPTYLGRRDSGVSRCPEACQAALLSLRVPLREAGTLDSLRGQGGMLARRARSSLVFPRTLGLGSSMRLSRQRQSAALLQKVACVRRCTQHQPRVGTPGGLALALESPLLTSLCTGGTWSALARDPQPRERLQGWQVHARTEGPGGQ